MTQRLQRLGIFSVACTALLAAALFYLSQNSTHRANSTKTQPALVHSQVAQGPQVSRAMQSIARLPLSFEEDGSSAESGNRYVSRGPGYALGISGTGANLIRKYQRTADEANPVAVMLGVPVKVASEVRLTWIGARAGVRPKGVGRQQGISNYLEVKDRSKWRRQVAHYGNVKIANLYRGVDLVFHGDHEQLEFDYVVAPGGDASAIGMAIGTPSIVTLNQKGQLEISDGGDELVLQAPAAYQEIGGVRKLVKAEYVLASGHEVRLALGDYDKKRELVIDPVLSFASHFGSSSNFSLVSDVAVDGSGDIYLTGRTCDVDYPVTAGALQRSGGSNTAILCDTGVITKLDATASNLIYSTYIGSANNVTSGIRIVPVGGGAALVAGVTTATDFPTTSNAYQRIARGGTCTYGQFLQNRPCTDGFLLKLSSDGSSLVFSTYLGGSRAELVSAMTVDGSGNIFLAGTTNSGDFPVTTGAVLGGGTCHGGLYPCFDAFAVKFNSDGSQLLLATLLGGNDDDFASGIAVDGTGSIYLGGTAYSTNFPTTAGSYHPTHYGTVEQGDAFVSKLTPDMKTLTYSTFIGGSGADIGLALKVDSTGAAYITGSTASTDFPTTTGSFQTAYRGPTSATCNTMLDSSVLNQPSCGDIFVSKLNAAGTALVYSTYIGGTGQDIAFNASLDSGKNLWLLANTDSTDFPYSSDAYYTSAGSNVALVELSADGKTVPFATPLVEGTAGQALALGLTINGADEVYVAGQATIFSPTPGTFSSGTGPSIFLAKFIPGTARPGLQLSATNIAFPGLTTPVGATSAPQSVTLTNNGTATLHLAISLVPGFTGNLLPFSEYDNCGSTVAPGGNCTINVVYQPVITVGNNDGGTIQILSDAPHAPHKINLGGSSGTIDSASFVPPSLTFIGQAPGTASPAQFSSLNTPASSPTALLPITLGLPVLSGPNASEFAVNVGSPSNCPVNGHFCELSVTFNPAANATGTRTAFVSVPSEAANSPQTLSLVGMSRLGPLPQLHLRLSIRSWLDRRSIRRSW